MATERDAPHPDGDRAAGLKRDKDAVLVAYHGAETSNAIAARYGVSPHTVLYWLHRWGADVRPANRTLPEHVTGKGLQAALAEAREDATCLRIDSDEASELLAAYQRGRGAIPADDPVAEAMDILGGEGRHAAQLRADSAELARQQRRAAALEESLRQVGRIALLGEEGCDTPETLGHIVALIDEVLGAPGQGGEGGGR